MIKFEDLCAFHIFYLDFLPRAKYLDSNLFTLALFSILLVITCMA